MRTAALLLLCACAEVGSSRDTPRRGSVNTTAKAPPKPTQPTPRPAPEPEPEPEPEDMEPGTPRVVITEIRATGPDWVEICNRGTASADISGFAIADSSNGGTPKLSDAVRFSAATTLTAGACVVLLGDQDQTGTMPTTECDGVVATCWHAKWKISDGDGENIHLLAADDSIVETIAYPAKATDDDHTYARNTNDVWALALPSPGLPNP